MRLTILLFALTCTACGSSLPTAPAPVPALEMLTETLTGTITGGEAMCYIGTFPQSRCVTIARTLTHAGRVSAELSWTSDTELLGLHFYQPSTLDIVAFGTLTFDPYPSKTAHQVFVADAQPGRYEVRVYVTIHSLPTDYTLKLTHPN